MEEKSHLDELQSQYTDLQKEYESILANQKLQELEKRVISGVMMIGKGDATDANH